MFCGILYAYMDPFFKPLMENARTVLDTAEERNRPVETHWEEGGVQYEGQRLSLKGLAPDQENVHLSILHILSRSGDNLRNALPLGLTVVGHVRKEAAFEGDFMACEQSPSSASGFYFNGMNGAYRASEAFLNADVKAEPVKPATRKGVMGWFGRDSAVV